MERIKDDLTLPYQFSKENYEEFKETLNTGFTADYLSWSVCWDKLKQLYPTATHEMVKYDYDGKPVFGIINQDGSIMVHCKIHYELEDGNSYCHNEYLAVRNKRNQANLEPNSADIENTYRRALAKAVSTLTGYGISLWMNEDLRELMHTETRMDTSVPKEGEITVDQNVKLDRLMRDKYTSDADKERISTLKKSGWKLENIVITELMAQALISDVEHGRKNNMKATKKSKELITKEILSDDNNLTDDIRKKSIVWLNDENRTNGELTALKVKLNLKED
tara:strand:+ start:18998 stop:19834 length:837 start_codon:yes stop_codon:yes gene_type:complete